MTPEQAKKAMQRIEVLTQVAPPPLSDKETEVLGKLLTSEIMTKAFAHLYAYAQKAPESFVNMNLSDSAQLNQAVKLQGWISGLVNATELLFGLAVTEEDEQDQETEESQ